jgi:hypothetical protein
MPLLPLVFNPQCNDAFNELNYVNIAKIGKGAVVKLVKKVGFWLWAVRFATMEGISVRFVGVLVAEGLVWWTDR